MLKTTAGWDDAQGVTVVQRHKEEAADYRYFPEPDLVPVVVSAEADRRGEGGDGRAAAGAAEAAATRVRPVAPTTRRC